MTELLNQLGHLFVQSIPTVIFVFLLLIILERFFFRPLTTILQKREEATSGALARAKEQTALAETKAKEYETAFQAARQDVYKLREEGRKSALEERGKVLLTARAEAEAYVKDAADKMNLQVEAAKKELDVACQTLGSEIADAVLGGGAPSR